MRLHPDADPIGIWDEVPERGKRFAQEYQLRWWADLADMLANCDAVCVASENKRHAEHIEICAAAGKHILCEKPLATTEEEAQRIENAVGGAGVKLLTAFPCRFSPAYQRLKERVRSGEIGAVRAVCATNRGQCPFGWFVEPEKSGGGAMMDHVVHVMDLLQDLLGERAVSVQAHANSEMYGQVWDDCALVTVTFPSGVFATIDSSWSRPKSYKTWGDVTMNVIGDSGVIEMDMFGQYVQHYHSGPVSHTVAGYGIDMDSALVNEFIRVCMGKPADTVTMMDGLDAARVSMKGYASLVG
jgi:predicted dehydrogenase